MRTERDKMLAGELYVNQPFYCDYGKHIRVGKRFFANFGLTILPGVTIGANCTIGAGSVVTHDLAANCIAAGNPCKIIKNIR